MARARNIKPSFFTNEIIGTLDPLIGMTFIGLWCLADRTGRLEDRPLRIKAELFPYRDGTDVNGYLTVLERTGFVERYEVDGTRFIQIVNFEKHQAPHHTEKAKGYPPKPSNYKAFVDLTVKQQLQDGETQVPTRSDSLIPDSLIPDSLIPDSKPKPERAKRALFDPLSIDLPSCIDSETWATWIAYRRERKLTVTERATRAQVAFLEEMNTKGHNTKEIVLNSVRNGWQGLFEPRANGQMKNAALESVIACGKAIFGDIENGRIIELAPIAREVDSEDFFQSSGKLRNALP